MIYFSVRNGNLSSSEYYPIVTCNSDGEVLRHFRVDLVYIGGGHRAITYVEIGDCEL